jgi:hypothetical protein
LLSYQSYRNAPGIACEKSTKFNAPCIANRLALIPVSTFYHSQKQEPFLGIAMLLFAHAVQALPE